MCFLTFYFTLFSIFLLTYCHLVSSTRRNPSQDIDALSVATGVIIDLLSLGKPKEEPDIHITIGLRPMSNLMVGQGQRLTLSISLTN